MNFVLGLTGGIGSGKSMAASTFSELGANVIDADQVAREVVSPGSHALDTIIQHFGPQILLPDGSLNRAALRKRIFSNQVEKQWLNDLLHPLIREEMLSQLHTESCHLYSILEAPLLLENKLQQHVDKIAVVDVPEALQLRRAAARDVSTPEQIHAIMSSQISRKERVKQADYILNNELTPDDLKKQVYNLHLHICDSYL